MDSKGSLNHAEIAGLEPIPLPEYDGITWPSFPSFRKKGAENAVKDITNLQTRETDILICTHVKSGTHWTYEIIKMIVGNQTELDKSSKMHTMLDILHDLTVLDAMPSPRIMDTHFPFKYIPVQHIDKRNKIVHMVRNPKDVLVSLYYHGQKDKFLNLKVPFKECFDIWMSGKMPYGSWYEYELEMEQAGKDYPGLIYTCYYEDMKRNPELEIRKLADFLEVECTETVIKSIAVETSFGNMQKNKFDVTKAIDGKGFIFRKGDIGDWKNHFTVAQNEQFDEQLKVKMKDSKLKLTFE